MSNICQKHVKTIKSYLYIYLYLYGFIWIGRIDGLLPLAAGPFPMADGIVTTHKGVNVPAVPHASNVRIRKHHGIPWNAQGVSIVTLEHLQVLRPQLDRRDEGSRNLEADRTGSSSKPSTDRYGQI